MGALVLKITHVLPCLKDTPLVYLLHKLRNCTSWHTRGYIFTRDTSSLGLPTGWQGLRSAVAVIPPLDMGVQDALAGANGRAPAFSAPPWKLHSLIRVVFSINTFFCLWLEMGCNLPKVYIQHQKFTQFMLARSVPDSACHVFDLEWRQGKGLPHSYLPPDSMVQIWWAGL